VPPSFTEGVTIYALSAPYVLDAKPALGA